MKITKKKGKRRLDRRKKNEDKKKRREHTCTNRVRGSDRKTDEFVCREIKKASVLAQRNVLSKCALRQRHTQRPRPAKHNSKTQYCITQPGAARNNALPSVIITQSDCNTGTQRHVNILKKVVVSP